MSDAHCELRFGETSVELPVVVGSEGEKAIDIGKLRAQTGLVTLDPGFANTGSCQSDITFIDMSGPGAVTPFAHTINLCVQLEPHQEAYADDWNRASNAAMLLP